MMCPVRRPSTIVSDIADTRWGSNDRDELNEISKSAESHDTGIVDKIGAYYAQHPEVVKVLGGAALAIALGRMAKGTPQR